MKSTDVHMYEPKTNGESKEDALKEVRQNWIELRRAVVLYPFILAYRAYVISFLWVWFAVPLGVISLSFMEIVGLLLLISTLRIRTPEREMAPWEKKLKHGVVYDVVVQVAGLSMCWGMAALVHFYL
jgi:hypothetical protein